MGLLKRFLNNCRCPEGAAGKLMLHGMTFGHRWISAWGLSHLNGLSPNSIVDLGCGSGANAAKLLELFPEARVTAADYSQKAVAHARKKLADTIASGRCDVVRADVSDLPFPDGSFDVATAFETVYFWPGPLKSFREVARTLRSGGLFMITNEAGGREDMPVDWGRWVDGLTCYDGATLERLLREAGFSRVTVKRRPKLGWLSVLAYKAR
ncbi:MAG: methyltransferase domain-containing protein [Pyramidobacter sp.]|nr:methyltransferase domain-containing protein [Pyramidobacter sp.]